MFGGFIAFACHTRADSRMVIGSLRESAHAVMMVTGDAPLTALHVAGETGIADAPKRALLLTATKAPGADEDEDEELDDDDVANPLLAAPGGGAAKKRAPPPMVVEWVDACGEEPNRRPFDAAGMCALAAAGHDLMMTEDALHAASTASDGDVWNHVDLVRVFARMSPQGKAQVIRAMQVREPRSAQ